MPKDADRRIADGKILPDPEDGDRARPARNGLDLPGPGELRLGGGQAGGSSSLLGPVPLVLGGRTILPIKGHSRNGAVRQGGPGTSLAVVGRLPGSLSPTVHVAKHAFRRPGWEA